MKAFFRYIIAAVIAGTIAFTAFHYRNAAAPIVEHIKTTVMNAIVGTPACTQPISYSLGTFDARFSISKAQFLNDVALAGTIWDKTIGRTLFRYSPAGALKINLIYDYRQQATVEMQSLGIVISDNKSTYDQLKTKYDALSASYAQQKAALDREIASYDSAKATYEQQAAYWNARGGAPQSQYNALEARRQAVNAQADAINQSEASLNGLVETINSTATILNRLASELNLNVKSYNTIGASTGVEFDEGEYVSDADGQHIDIYQFENNDKLVRVLEHEMGHALGLQHVDDPKAIMYRLNEGTNEAPTASDIDELKNVCGI